MPARYDDVAAWYAAGPDHYSHPALAALLELANPVSGDRALDLACGHGLVARELARRGARVVGLDLSDQLLQRAQSMEADTNLGIEYVHGDAADPTALDAASFDLVTCNFGLSDIDDLDGVCATVTRVLAGGGRFVFSILHPCFAGAAQVNASWPSDGAYYDEGWWRADRELSTLRQQVGSNHRMLSTYVNALARHGIPIETLVEPPPESSWTTERPAAASLPVYFVARCRRPPTG